MIRIGNHIHTPNLNEHIWNSESPMSKLGEIKKVLIPTEWDPFNVKIIKTNLLQLLKSGNYTAFQRKIGVPNKQCDGLLGTTSLNYLIEYIAGIEIGEERNIIGETIKYIGNILKHGKVSPEEITEPKNRISSSIQQDTPTSNPSSQIKHIKKNIYSDSMFGDTPIGKIVSHSTIKNEETESYCCSKTARLNGLHFGISLPRGNAYNAGIIFTKGIIKTIPKEKSWDIPDKTRIAIKESEFNGIDKSINFADIYAESSTTYGHRAVAIRDSTGKWYILDPYIKINGKKSLKPIKLKDYITKGRKILKAHFYHSNGYIN